MREPWEWTEEDLQAFVDNQATESIELDFKACAAIDLGSPKGRDKSKLELTKDVSAFANSAGGNLVYGIIEDTKTHTATGLDLGYDPAEVNHEWIGQVINSIQPRINGVRVNAVSLEKHSSGRVAYVVYTPQSPTAHQARDSRYYKRYNFESVPMEDYEIRDVMQRAQAPIVDILATHEGRAEGTFDLRLSGDFLWSPALSFHWSSSAGGAIAEFAQAHVFISGTVQPQIGPFVDSTVRVDAAGGHLTYGYREYRITRADVPLFAGERRPIEAFGVNIPAAQKWSEDHWVPLILWRVRAGSAQPRVGAVLFQRVVHDTWAFRGADMGELETLGYSVQWGS